MSKDHVYFHDNMDTRMKFVATGLTVGGAVVAVLAVTLRYLIPLWPVEGIDNARLAVRLITIQSTALLLALAGAFIIGRTAESLARRWRIFVLGTAVLIVGLVAGFNQKPTAPSMAKPAILPAKYRFSEDWISSHTATWERVLGGLKGKPNVRGLEIGSFEGRSALWFLENVLTHPTSTITCVDIWEGDYEQTFDANMKAYGRPEKLTKIKSRSDEALRNLKLRNFDFIYIDGSHEAKDVLVDAVLTWDLLKPGGIMIFDDYNWVGIRSWLVPNYTPKIAVNAFVEIFDPYIEVLTTGFQLIIRKKTDLEEVDLDTYKWLRSFVRAVQRILG